MVHEWAPYLDSYGAEFGRLDAKHAENATDSELVGIRAEMPRPEIAVGVEVGKRYGPRQEDHGAKQGACGTGCASTPVVTSAPDSPAV